jgi:hypothetical protein
MTIQWHHDIREQRVCSRDDLDQLLDAILKETSATHPRGIFIRSETGYELMFVLGGDRSFVSWDGRHGNPPYYASMGDAYDDNNPLTYYILGLHHNEAPARYVIGPQEAREAAAEFFATGVLPSCIEWDEI